MSLMVLPRRLLRTPGAGRSPPGATDPPQDDVISTMEQIGRVVRVARPVRAVGFSIMKDPRLAWNRVFCQPLPTL